MKIYREEIFGSFVIISSFKIEEEAVRRANDTTYGLGSSMRVAELVALDSLGETNIRHGRSSLRTSRRRIVLPGTLKLTWCGSTPTMISTTGMFSLHLQTSQFT
jgi:hypothetical protein